MAPKKKKGGGKAKGGGGKSKTMAKKAEKIAADKTFGLKNKNKSKKVQQYVATVAQQARMRGKSAKQLQAEEKERKAKQAMREAKARKEQEMASLFKAVTKSGGGGGGGKALDKSVDPKSQLCAFFAAGSCKRGKKCKFSHDMTIERKVAKINLYEDPRAKAEAEKEESMEDWDQAKLEDVVNKRHAKGNETAIVCKYFLEAIEKRKYGWRWKCPNGGDSCRYRHRLPPGYVLKKKEDESKKEDDGPSLEEVVEQRRRLLDSSKCTPVTEKTFREWKARQIVKEKEREERERKEAAKAASKSEKRGDKAHRGLTGRALFAYDATLFEDDADAEEQYEIPEDAENDEDGGGGGGDERKDAAAAAAPAGNKADGDELAAGPVKRQASDEVEDQQKKVAGVAVGDASLFLDDDDDLPDDIDDDDDDDDDDDE